MIAVALWDDVLATVGQGQGVQHDPRHKYEGTNPAQVTGDGDRPVRDHDGIPEREPYSNKDIQRHNEQYQRMNGPQRVHEKHLSKASGKGSFHILPPVHGNDLWKGHNAKQEVCHGQMKQGPVRRFPKSILVQN